MLTLNDIKKHAKKCNRKGIRYNWLKFTENEELSPEVEALFSFTTPSGFAGYDWVHGNKKLADFLLTA